MFQFPQNNWLPIFQKWNNEHILTEIRDKLKFETQKGKVSYPPSEMIFRAFELCDFKELKVVILGQDPYHGENEANGLCFSVVNGVKIPPSLRNIFKELLLEYSDYDIKRNTDLSDWASQGVLLLNSILTVEKDQAASHAKMGWQGFTDGIISDISAQKNNIIFILLGNFAQSKISLIDNQKHKIISAVHPSPLSANRGFFGSNVFRKCNEELIKNGQEGIQW